MKALSFRQPWAELIVQGRKRMDLRTYRTNHRGPLAIHASKKIERDACTGHGLNPDDLDTGGVVGVVELVDVIPLTKFDYEAHRDEHLAGRNFREPMFGWVLVKPQRLPRMVPARGRMSLFNVDLEIETPLQDRQPASSLQVPTRAPGRQGGVYQTDAGSDDREKPFTVYVKPLNGVSTSYAWPTGLWNQTLTTCPRIAVSAPV
jgi:hypothetical protein